MPKTPLIKINDFYLKREDCNPTGSAKDRALSVQIQHLVNNNIHQAVISSTGNAAISAIHYCRQNKINLTIFVSSKINPAKLKLLSGNSIITSPNPIKDAFAFSKQQKYYYLRQSTDPNALLGYQSISVELLEQLPQVSSIFLAIASGTTLLGIKQKLPPNVKVFAVQPASYCPISSHFDKNYHVETENITDALCVKYLPLKSKILSFATGGYVVQNQQILSAQKILNKNNIITSNEGALALAGLFKAKIQNDSIGNYPVIILTGAKR